MRGQTPDIVKMCDLRTKLDVIPIRKREEIRNGSPESVSNLKSVQDTRDFLASFNVREEPVRETGSHLQIPNGPTHGFADFTNPVTHGVTPPLSITNPSL